MVVNNVARKICTQPRSTDGKEPDLNAFDASMYLAAAFCKLREDALADILRCTV